MVNSNQVANLVDTNCTWSHVLVDLFNLFYYNSEQSVLQQHGYHIREQWEEVTSNKVLVSLFMLLQLAAS